MEHLSTPDSESAAKQGLAAFRQDERAVTAIEYGLLAALVCLACLGAFTTFSGALEAIYQSWVTPALAAIVQAL